MSLAPLGHLALQKGAEASRKGTYPSRSPYESRHQPEAAKRVWDLGFGVLALGGLGIPTEVGPPFSLGPRCVVDLAVDRGVRNIEPAPRVQGFGFRASGLGFRFSGRLEGLGVRS